MQRRQSDRPLRFQPLEQRLVLDATLLNNGEEVRREVGQEDPFDEFFFDAQDGDYVWVSLGEERAKSNNTLRLEVETPSGFVLTDTGSENAFSFFRTTESGRYKIFVSEVGNEQDFDYVIRLIVQPEALDFTYYQDSVVSGGDRHTASLGFGQLSIIQFQAEAGKSVIATLGETFTQPANPILWIVDPLGSLLDLNGGVNGSTISAEVGLETTFTAQKTGVYTAVVGDSGGNETLSYSFSFVTFPGPVDYSLPQNTLLQNGERHTSTVDLGQQHIIQFEATSGSTVVATMGETTTTIAEPKLRIVDPLGNALDLNGGVNGTALTGNPGLETLFIAPASGLYTAIISDDGNNDVMDYTFSLFSASAAVDYSVPQNVYMNNSERRTSTLFVGEQDLIQFDAQAGTTIVATLGETTTTESEPKLRIIDPLGNRIDLNGGVNGTQITGNPGLETLFIAPASGLYTAIISDDGNNDQFDYTFSLFSSPVDVDYSVPQNALVTSGERRTSILGVGEQELIQFNAVAGNAIYSTLAETTTADSEPKLRVIDPLGNRIDLNGGVNGTQLTGNPGLESLFFAPTSGIYTAIISDDGNNDLFDYTFRVSVFGQAPIATLLFEEPLADGDAQGKVLTPGNHSVHPFQVESGDSPQIAVSDVGVDSSAFIRLQIFNPTGQRIWNDTANTEEIVNVTGGPGQYFAVVSESGSNRELNYSIIATGISTTPTVDASDYNSSGTVDAEDLSIWELGYGVNASADGDRDGDSDGNDFLLWQRNIGSSALLGTASASTPDVLAMDEAITSASDIRLVVAEEPLLGLASVDEVFRLNSHSKSTWLRQSAWNLSDQIRRRANSAYNPNRGFGLLEFVDSATNLPADPASLGKHSERTSKDSKVKTISVGNSPREDNESGIETCFSPTFNERKL